MKANAVGHKVQAVFDWMREAVEPVETRWLLFASAVMLLALLRALGAHGLSTFLSLIYIMYFVTIALPDRDR